MKYLLPILMTLILGALIFIGAANGGHLSGPENTPEGAVQSFLDDVKARDWDAAYGMLAPSSNLEKFAFIRDIAGTDDSLKTFSGLQDAETKVLRQSQSDADVRVNFRWSTAVGALRETRDLKVVNDQGVWRLLWSAAPPQKVPGGAIESKYLRWDIIERGQAHDDWGAQNLEAPRMDIVSMNAIERDGSVIVMGEVVNQDTIPGFVTINAELVGKDGKVIAQESSFDKISHTLLPKEVSPFRVDFPNTKLADVKSVRLDPNTLLVPAYADPVIAVLKQEIKKDANGHTVLTGELENDGGKPVNIPHVIATYYDSVGRVIWVSDGYVDRALMPHSPVPFSVSVRDDLADKVGSYRVTVNHYSSERG